MRIRRRVCPLLRRICLVRTSWLHRGVRTLHISSLRASHSSFYIITYSRMHQGVNPKHILAEWALSAPPPDESAVVICSHILAHLCLCESRRRADVLWSISPARGAHHHCLFRCSLASLLVPFLKSSHTIAERTSLGLILVGSVNVQNGWQDSFHYQVVEERFRGANMWQLWFVSAAVESVLRRYVWT